jgi:wyosine [tRNA(Phe)-imidazoG37] synthetase (radical SAM superfamily)
MTDDVLTYSNHRHEREAGFLAYPVVSRRSEGLSLGINLFPDRKLCNFDCLYCEVLPFGTDQRFSLESLEAELEDFFDRRLKLEFSDYPLRDITFSGNGEPTLSPDLEAALGLCARIRRDRGLTGVKLVVITNSTRLDDPETAAMLGNFVRTEGLEVWAKLDAGSVERYLATDRSAIPFHHILSGLASFGKTCPVVIQTMVSRIEGKPFDPPEIRAYVDRLRCLRSVGAKITGIQLYTKARPSGHEGSEAVSDGELVAMAEIVLREVPGIPVTVYGQNGRIPLA